MPYSVARTDCRTGWQVRDQAGRPVRYSTFRHKIHADGLAAQMNAKVGDDRKAGDDR